MKQFLFIYHGGDHPTTDEETKQVMADWMKWFKDMGDAVVDGGNPVGMSSTVNPDGSVSDDGGSNPAGGYGVFQAESKDAVLALAKQCPILQANGSIEVAEIVEVGMSDD